MKKLVKSHQYKKYRYLGIVDPVVPDSWALTILTMLKEIDQKIKPKYVPRFVLNFMNDISCNIEGQITNIFVYSKLQSLISNVAIKQIKQKFAILKVVGKFTPEIQIIVNNAETICSNTCEYCGTVGTTHTMVKSWVRNLCVDCKEKTKKNGVNN